MVILFEGDGAGQELSNKKKFIKIGPLLRKLQANYCLGLPERLGWPERSGNLPERSGRLPKRSGSSRAFKQKKIHQNRTIIKEVTSKLLIGLARVLGQFK